MRLLWDYLLPGFLVAGIFLVIGCHDLTVENLNQPDREHALATSSDLLTLLRGGHDDIFSSIHSLWGVHMNGLSDQMTSTNAFLSFWDFAHQPRLRLDNTQTYATPGTINGPWSSFNSGVSTANSILTTIEEDGRTVLTNGNDRTHEVRAAAYLLRGVARGYLGMIYDKGYIVGPDTDVSELEPSSYSELISAAVTDLGRAKNLAGQVNRDFTWDFLPNADSFSRTEFKEIANSFAARFLINEARTVREAEAWSNRRWNDIINYAETGVGQGASMPSFTATTVGSYEFYPSHPDWETFIVPLPAGYLPNDIKQAHLLDPSYPVDYPTEAGAVLDEAKSQDPRIQYFNYVGSNFGFLDPSRNRALFTSYVDLRMNGDNSWGRSGLPMTFVTGSEMQYIIAEAYLMKGNKAAAAEALENSPFGSVPTDLGPFDLPAEQDGKVDYGSAEGLAANREIAASASRAEFVRALHTEYSVELHLLGGIGIQWFFMRRHNLLQEGTPLHYPIPGKELQVTGRDYYSFGGVERSDEEGTASGSNSWKTFDDRHGIKSMVGVPVEHSSDTEFYTAPTLQVEPEYRSRLGGTRHKGNH